MKEASLKVKKRILFVMAVFFLSFVLLVGRLFYLQLIKGEELKKRAFSQWTRERLVAPKRGSIVDRNGKILAMSITAETVVASLNQIKDKEWTAKVLSGILQIDYKKILNKLNTKGVSDIYIARNIDKEKADKIRKYALPGIYLTGGTKRVYPNGNFLAQVLGFTGIDDQGLSGLELYYDKYLRGKPGAISAQTDASGRAAPFSEEFFKKPVDGYDLMLTIDETIQHFAEKYAQKALYDNKAKNVTIIVEKVKTGEILAMTSKPDFDPNKPFELIYKDKFPDFDKLSQAEKNKIVQSMWRNRALTDTYEPGSTFKIVTAAAGLEEGVVNENSQFYCRGYVKVANAILKCWRYYNPHGSENFVEGVQNSCNPVFIEVGQRLGKEKLYKYINLFGFGQKTGIDLPGEAKGIVQPLGKVGPVELATISFGQGISATPIQVISMINAVANDGVWVQPHVVKAIYDKDKKLIKSFDTPQKRRVLDQDVARRLKVILQSVVTNGTGHNAYLLGYKVAGKTGTSQKYDKTSKKYIASFGGFAPADNPEVSVLVIIDEPDPSLYYGGLIAAPVARDLLNDILRYLDIQPQYTAEELKQIEFYKEYIVPNTIGMNVEDAKKEINDNKFNAKVIGNGNKVIDQVPKAGFMLKEGSTIILFTQEMSQTTVAVPNVVGLSFQDAQKVLSNSLLNIKVKGIKGKIIRQNPQPGTKVSIGSIIEVEIADKENAE
ncbi:stage V sporulation protein D [Caldicellulosiruptor kronotskyensis 2002]|uniref:Stage V sporulation protein D n=1 Tax=Caldicellulosiruptor kronotskyensis (strain DSM 18902 / VKM B-2412 / 2002) TaxID=632348 RepID=E4SG50_CALK2|nr:stage V sporulation protein D [Caldicellulosiruptor kronotskyensis]ADQ46725.1 stage V sporulation protein D [Caldicellulosiruptor kronotskyensis 2002]